MGAIMALYRNPEPDPKTGNSGKANLPSQEKTLSNTMTNHTEYTSSFSLRGRTTHLSCYNHK